MSGHSATPDRRDDRAADRDDVAERRDHQAGERDREAGERDGDADERDEFADEDSQKLEDLFDRARSEVLDRFARTEAETVDPALWPDLTSAALTRLQATVAEQRRLAALDRAAIVSLLDRLHDEFCFLRDERLAAAHDRRASALDRRLSARNRQDSAGDRGQSEVDRDESATGRAQVDPRDLPLDGVPGTPGPR